MESVFYEVRPFLYVAGAAVARWGRIVQPTPLINISALLLCISAAIILNWRYQARYVKAKTRK